MHIEELMDAEQWLHGAPIGSEITYYRGNLQRARDPNSRNGRRVNALATMMLAHSGSILPKNLWRHRAPHKVALYQVRHGIFDYSYKARKVRA